LNYARAWRAKSLPAMKSSASGPGQSTRVRIDIAWIYLTGWKCGIITPHGRGRYHGKGQK